MISGRIHERGNGFPTVGDKLAHPDGGAVVVREVVGPIHTRQWEANFVFAEVEPSDDDGDTFPADFCPLFD